MAEPDRRPVTMEELLVSSLAQTDALAKLSIEKGIFRLVPRTTDMGVRNVLDAVADQNPKARSANPQDFLHQPLYRCARANRLHARISRPLS